MNNLEFNPSSTSDCISNAENSQVADESKIRVTVRAPKNKASAYSPSAKSESKGMSSKETVHCMTAYLTFAQSLIGDVTNIVCSCTLMRGKSKASIMQRTL